LENEKSYFQAEFGNFKDIESDKSWKESDAKFNSVRFEKKWAQFEFRGKSYGRFMFGLRIRVSGEVLEAVGGSVLWIGLVLEIESILWIGSVVEIGSILWIGAVLEIRFVLWIGSVVEIESILWIGSVLEIRFVLWIGSVLEIGSVL
jgi:hypothetical protein